MSSVQFYLGARCGLTSATQRSTLRFPANHLVTHGVVVGMTGSGKTGLVTVMVEEALRNKVPTLIIDVKGDLPNLLLSFPSFEPSLLLPWIEGLHANVDIDPQQVAMELTQQRQSGLAKWNIREDALAEYVAGTDVRVITPGSSAGELLHVFSSLERRSPRWDTDPESARASLSAAVSLVLRLLGLDADPAKSREHVVLSTFAERRLKAGGSAALELLLQDLMNPPMDRIGALELDTYLSKVDRRALAAGLNTLLVSPAFASWREGTSLDVEEWMRPKEGRTPAVIVSVAHLDDDERELVLGVLLEEVLSWMRSLPGSQRLRAMVVFDEMYGFLPPHPKNPPTKRPLVAMMKQARAFGVGVLLATQNPMDLDYRALSNAGLWCVGRLQTDADRARVIDGLSTAVGDVGLSKAELANTLKRLSSRWFVMRDAHSKDGTVLLQPRYAMSLLRGPMTRREVRMAREGRAAGWVERTVLGDYANPSLAAE